MKFRPITVSMSGYDELIEVARPANCGGLLTTPADLWLRSTDRAFIESRCFMDTLEDHLDGELNLARRGGGSGHYPRSSRWRSRPIEDVGICRRRRWSKIGMIENVEDLGAELYVELFRDALDVVVLKQGEVQLGYSRTHQNIATGIAAKVEASQRRQPASGRVR